MELQWKSETNSRILPIPIRTEIIFAFDYVECINTFLKILFKIFIRSFIYETIIISVLVIYCNLFLLYKINIKRKLKIKFVINIYLINIRILFRIS